MLRCRQETLRTEAFRERVREETDPDVLEGLLGQCHDDAFAIHETGPGWHLDEINRIREAGAKERAKACEARLAEISSPRPS